MSDAPEKPRARKRLQRLALFVALACTAHTCGCLGGINDLLVRFESDAPSKSKGKASRGSLVAGKRLPSSGENFETYSEFGSLIGRTHVHSRVREVVLGAYASLAESHPDTTFVYAETGWGHGGSFEPHRTHQNGLSVDFIVPMADEDGAPDTLSCWPWNAWCYGIEFDAKGRLGARRIDFSALNAHLLALDAAARANGARVQRVIFDPKLRPRLFAAEGGARVRKRITFMKRRAWVRHDDHYHVDFALE